MQKALINRRRFLITSTQMAMGLIAASALPSFGSPLEKKELSFFHTHTHEQLTLGHTPGFCSQSTQRQLDLFLRDFRTGEIHSIDFKLLDTLYYIHQNSGKKGTFEVISGYRSPTTNQYLRRISNGVAQKSLHLKGQAIDIRLSGVSSRKVRDLAIRLESGGVGFYEKSDFVHLDTGHFRTW